MHLAELNVGRLSAPTALPGMPGSGLGYPPLRALACTSADGSKERAYGRAYPGTQGLGRTQNCKFAAA